MLLLLLGSSALGFAVGSMRSARRRTVLAGDVELDSRAVPERPEQTQADLHASSQFPWPVLTIDHQGQISFANPAAAALLGRSDLGGQPLRSLVHDEDHARLETLLEAAPDAPDAPASVRLQSNAQGWLHCRLRRSCGDSGIPGVRSLLLEDWTAECAELAAIQQREALYRTLIDQQTDLVSLADHRGILTFVNQAYSRHFGRPVSEMVGVSLFEFIPPAERMSVQRHIRHVLETGRVAIGQNRLSAHDGKELWMEWMNRAIPDSTGQATILHSVGRDITERRRTETAMALLHAEQSAILDSELIGIARVRVTDRRYSWVSHGYARMLGYGAEELIGAETRPLYVDVREYEQLAVGAFPILRSGGSYRTEFQGRCKDGQIVWLEATGVMFGPTHDESLWVFTDITPRKTAELALRENLAVTESQRQELVAFRDAAESEAELARFLLNRLSRAEQLAAAGSAYYWVPAAAFSGDLLAVATSSTGDAYAMLADATGHGLAAAINLIPLATAFYAMAAKGFNLVSISEQLNQVVKDYSLPDRFVAVTLARITGRERRVEVANAGNPAAVLIDREHKVVREFHSSSVPFGILGRPHFQPRIDVAELQAGDRLLLFSDGLLEALDTDGQPFGRDGLAAALAAPQAFADLAGAIGAAVETHAQGAPQHDDISVLILDSGQVPESVRSDTWSHRIAGSSARPPGADGREQDSWRIALCFSTEQLQHVEVVPVLVDLARTCGLGPRAVPRFFTILSELCVNALEHGLLGLDSDIKREVDGFDRYQSMRAERLAALSGATMEVTLTHWRMEPGGRFRIEVRDSGPGFDHAAHMASFTNQTSTPDGEASQPLPFGRGLSLLLTLCDRVTFNAAGNGVTAEFSYR